MLQSRQAFLRTGAAFAVGSAVLRDATRATLAQTATTLAVAYAGSMSSIMEGPIKQLASEHLGVTLQGRAQGASGLAALIAGGSLTPDVFISVTPEPIQTVIKAGKADSAQPIARTAMVIAYSPKGAFAQKLADAGKSGAGRAWWQVLEEKGMRFGRTDPATDPQGRNIIFVMQLAADLYGQPDLPRRILGPDIKPSQIFSEPTVQARLQSGQLDAASAYKIQPVAFKLPYIMLPDAINLSDDGRKAEYDRASLSVNGKVYRPEPLVYYAAVVKGAPAAAQAAAFVKWLSSAHVQAVFRRYGYDPAGNAAPLHI